RAQGPARATRARLAGGAEHGAFAPVAGLVQHQEGTARTRERGTRRCHQARASATLLASRPGLKLHGGGQAPRFREGARLVEWRSSRSPAVPAVQLLAG